MAGIVLAWLVAVAPAWGADAISALLYVDEDGAAGPKAVWSLPPTAWAPAGDGSLSLGFRDAAVWLRLTLPPGPTGRVLELPDPLLDEVDLYRLQADGEWSVQRRGDHRPPPLTGFVAPGHRFTVAAEGGEVLLRVASQSSLLIRPQLYTPAGLEQRQGANLAYYGLFFGVLAAMALYNFMLFLGLRDPNYLLYVVVVVSTGCFLGVFSGHLPLLLWPGATAWSEGIYLHVLVVVLISALWFCVRFLDVPTHAPRLMPLFRGLVGLSLVQVPVYWLFGFHPAVHINGTVSALSGGFGLLAAIVVLRAGQRSARFYLTAWTGYCVGAILAALRQHGLVEDNLVSLHGMELGTMIETVLISIALADRYNSLRREKEQAQAALVAELHRLDGLKDQFLANTSHELRTPLHGIIGLSESLLDPAAEPLPARARHDLSMMSASARRLARLVDDLLDFSRLKSHDLRLNTRPVDMRVAVEVAQAMLQPLIAERGLRFDNTLSEDLPAVLADEERVQQILLNLIGNAIKFTDAGGITLSAEPRGAELAVTVADTGIGIAEADQERIFTAFEQIDGADSRARGGTGIGLSVTRQMVELQGGGITVESTPGEGARFSFTLPLAAADAEPAAPGSTLSSVHVLDSTPAPVVEHAAAAPRPDGEAIRVLVVDDEPVNQQVLANHLATHRYEVLLASSGAEALELLGREDDVALVLLDVMMPRMSGYEVCQHIRERHLPSELPVIMVTAKNQLDDLVNGLSSGANDYLAKPFAKQELLARIATHLNLLRINSAYGNFVPHEFLRHLGRDSIVDVRLGDNVELDMAILISDIRGFTALSETMTPAENFDFINSYFGRFGPVIRRHGGFISRYTGDSIMALFENGAEAALQSALDTLDGLRRYNAERTAAGRSPIDKGIGLHCGLLRLGVVGEMRRRQGDIFSDTVNLASRIEGLAKTYGARLIASGEFLTRLPANAQHETRLVDRLAVRGRAGRVDIHEFLAPAHDGEARLRTRDRYEQALHGYLDGELDAALAGFAGVLRENPADRAAAHHHGNIERELRLRRARAPVAGESPL